MSVAASRDDAVERMTGLIDEHGVELVRFAWCDLHGVTRCKALTASAAQGALRDGLGMVSTLMLKDTSDRTAYRIFEPGGTAGLDRFENAGNLLLVADPDSFRILPWAPATGWVRGQLCRDGEVVELDTRGVLQRALARLKRAGYRMCCGLEIEFHVYRIVDTSAQLDPEAAAWPGLPPEVALIHPGFNLLTEAWWDMAEEPMRIVQRTAEALGLPLLSLEIEFGPSQIEAVFDVTDALTAADNMVLFRSAVRQALRRAGYHATFMCRPPFPHIMSSGWHLHQSLVHDASGASAFVREAPEPGSTPADARHALSATGAHYLAGLLEHAGATAVFCTPTINGYERYRPNALAPQSVSWGRDNRGAMLRVIGACGDPATRIENRVGEPAANPYLYLAAQVHAGIDGIERALEPPCAADEPYAADAGVRLPASLDDALTALEADPRICAAFGPAFVACVARVKRFELARHAEAADKVDFARREYFSRI
jgi:glutamine synthetase